MDGNVLRVLYRLRMDGEDILSQKTKTRVEKELREVIPVNRPGDFNQALEKICFASPIRRMRSTFSPICPKISSTLPSASLPSSTGNSYVLVIQDEDRAAFRRRPEKGLLAGMYEFPIFRISSIGGRHRIVFPHFILVYKDPILPEFRLFRAFQLVYFYGISKNTH